MSQFHDHDSYNNTNSFLEYNLQIEMWQRWFAQAIFLSGFSRYGAMIYLKFTLIDSSNYGQQKVLIFETLWIILWTL